MPENVRIEEAGDGFTFVVVGDNGEVQARGEKYDTESNARRGAADLVRTLAKAVDDDELDPTIGEGG